VGTALAGAAGAVAGFAAVAGESFSVALPGLLPLSGMLFTLVALGGLFVAVRRARRTAASTGWCRGDDQVERAQCESGGAV
jgi:hydrogenase-4 component B